jgi:predicted type IV restriction endonuclease
MDSAFQQSKDDIARLVKHFATNRAAYLAPAYKEAHARQEFIDPFFVALGWDVHNAARAAPDYREVVVEDSLEVEGQRKAPDYVFRIGRERKFFAEAKKPGVDLKADARPAYQLRRYAWTAKLPLSVLSDFEELAVYDCRARPSEKDKPSVGRVSYYTFQEYPDRWGEIWEVFSREAVWGGSFDQYAQTSRGRRGTSEVDAEFLREIEGWRDALARNIALRNPRLTIDELNDAVQKTIDRLIFLRMAEDRGIEEYGRLQHHAGDEGLYRGLIRLFRHADAKYNSGLFDFSAAGDALTPKLAVDDKVLRPIVASLYFPQSPYEFSVLPVEILGDIYEQFLGKTIKLTEGHRAKVEEKPEVKKAGGVKYTPAYIVDYIVRNTVGKWIETHAGAGLASAPGRPHGSPLPPTFRVLDMACGSGSFLLGAYQYLLDYYLQWYVTHGPEKYPEAVWRPSPPDPLTPAIGRGEGWKLTTAEKKRILLNHIYGVDIDRQAVEVAKLSLLLKVLEGESDETLGKQLALFHERALPNLDRNIKCGNSLIGPDYFAGQLLPDANELRRVNAFDWESEFPEAMKAGGFTCVISNPPWGAEYTQQEKAYFRDKHEQIHVRTPESFNYFIKQMWDITGGRGVVGAIVPSSFLNQHEFWKTRQLLVESASISRVCNLGDGVFQGVTAPSCIVIFVDKGVQNSPVYLDLRSIDRANLPAELLQERLGQDASLIGQDSDSFILQVRPGIHVIQKCYSWPKLKDVAEDVATGISSGLDIAYVYKPEDVRRLKLEKKLLRKLVIGGEIHRYALTPTSGKQIIYITPETKIEEYPHYQAALLPYRDRLKNRREAANGQIPWFSLNWPRRRKLFDEPKILIRQTADRILATYDTEQWYCLKSAIIVQLRPDSEIRYEYLLALLNSSLMHFLYDDLVGEQSRVFPEVKPVQLFKLPIRSINFSDPDDKARHDRMVTLVEQMLDLHKRLHAAADAGEKERLQRLIDATDRQIDALVYELYGLTEEERAVVEGGGEKHGLAE